MSLFCRQFTKPTSDERAFCQALLNNENPTWDEYAECKIHKRGFRLPPENFVYGIKYPKQNKMTGVATALQDYCAPTKIRKEIILPNFIAINKAAARLGLTKVSDLHRYRKVMNNIHQTKINPCYCASTEKKLIPDIIHGRATEERQSIRDLIENKYLHEWLHKTAVNRCKEILTNEPRKIIRNSLLKPKYCKSK